LAVDYIFPVPGADSLIAIRQVKNFLLSPTSMTWLTNGNSANNSCSMISGGIFSPPAVIISYLTLPVINKTPVLSILPISPECKNP
jgi:hypothetical protein